MLNPDNNQKINCTVYSCRHNNQNKQECMLSSIIVTPTEENKSQLPDESMCSSYKYDNQ